MPAEMCRETCTACAGSMILEMAALSRLTGESIFEEKAQKAMDALWKMRHRGTDLMGSVLNVHSGDWVRRDSGVGAGIDSYYEYCLKAYILLGENHSVTKAFFQLGLKKFVCENQFSNRRRRKVLGTLQQALSGCDEVRESRTYVVGCTYAQTEHQLEELYGRALGILARIAGKRTVPSCLRKLGPKRAAMKLSLNCRTLREHQKLPLIHPWEMSLKITTAVRSMPYH